MHFRETAVSRQIAAEPELRKSDSIAGSYDMLRAQLLWTSVLISKTLHFLCLSLGFDNDPPYLSTVP